MTELARFREEFPVLANVTYLNAGTEGPMFSAAAESACAQIQGDLVSGRVDKGRFEIVLDLAERARAAYAEVLGATPEEVALTGSTTGGVNTVLGARRWQPGDEVVTSDQEHPGVLAPLRRLAVVHGVRIKLAPFAEVASAVGPKTKLVACSHVSWVGGEVADVAALKATGVPLLLDGAQGLGAVPVDVRALGVDYYAASGQKWLCGPEGSGALFVRADRLEGLEPPAPGYTTVTDHDDILSSPLASTAARFDDGFPSPVRSKWALVSMGRLGAAGWDWIHGQAAELAAGLAEQLASRGFEVAPRGRSTLVSWRPPDGDADAVVVRLAAEGIIVRSIPSAGLVRASVGAWSSPEDLARLLAAL